MFKKVLASLLFAALIGLAQAEDFAHVQFLWFKNWPPKWWPPKWWPWKGDGGGDGDGDGNGNGGGDGDEFEMSCHRCIERMADEALFDWESVVNGNSEFTDDSFPPDDTSMFWDDPYSDDMMTAMMRDTYEFRRVNLGDEIPEAAALFVSPSTDYFQQADQLYLGDCYFIEAASAAAYIAYPIEDTFYTDELNDNGIQVAKCYVKGIEQTIVVDTNLPFNVSNPNHEYLAFATQDGSGAVWNSVLEKMWAKTNCNYELITSGNPVEVYDWLLGVPVEQLWMDTDFGNDPNAVWTSITSHLDSGFIVGVGNSQSPSEYGLVNSHSWSVLNHYTVTDGGVCSSGCRILMIRNPWGVDSDYAADWRDDDSTHWTAGNIAQVSEYESADDGIYFISIEDFTDAYDAYQVGYWVDGWFHTTLEQQNIQTDVTYSYEIAVGGSGTIQTYIYINYYNDRMYPASCREDNDLIRGTMVLYDSTGAAVTSSMTTWDSIQNQKFFFIPSLNAGENYVLQVTYEDWPSGDVKDMTVKVYGESNDITITKMSNSEVNAFNDAVAQTVLNDGVGGVDSAQTSTSSHFEVVYGFNGASVYIQACRVLTCSPMNFSLEIDGVEGELTYNDATCTSSGVTYDCVCDMAATACCDFTYIGNSIAWDASLSFGSCS